MKETKLKAPTVVNFEITRNCNYKCLHCYNPNRFSTPSEENISEKSMKKIINILGRKGVFQVIISGGEPLLNKKLLLQTIKECKKYNMVVSLNTNCFYLDKKTANKLKRSGLDFITASLPSANKKINEEITQVKDSVDGTIHGIKNALQANLDISVNCVINQINFEKIEETVKILEKIGVKKIHISNYAVQETTGNTISLKRENVLKVLDKILELRKKYKIVKDMVGTMPYCISKNKKYRGELIKTCSAGNTLMGISPNGEVTACPHLSIFYGNILKEDFDNIWRKMSKWRNETYLPNKCRKCTVKNQCRGGCRASAYYVTKKMNGKDELMTKRIHTKSLNQNKIIDEFKEYRVIKNIRFRREGRNFIIYGRSPGSPILLDRRFFDFFSYLNGLSKINLKKTSEDTGINQSIIIDFLSRLKKKEMLEETKW